MDYSDFPTEEKKLPLKTIGIIAGGVIAIAIIIIVVVRIVSGSPEPITPIVDSTPKVADDAKSLSVENGDTSACEALEPTEKDDCFWGVANSKEDVSVCKKIVNTDWALRCKNGINKALAIKNNKESFCDKIEDEQKKTDCKDELAGPVTASNCADRGGEDGLCTMLAVAEQANIAQDKRVCEKLDAEFVESCKTLVISDDPDFDGLESDVEALYGSDPDLKDTDGDGYSDGDELSAGYDPAGPGTLE
jgi:hypothetical protein